jgi:hypothetical protein
LFRFVVLTYVSLFWRTIRCFDAHFVVFCHFRESWNSPIKLSLSLPAKLGT